MARKPKPDDGSVSQTEFDAACNERREARKQKRAAREQEKRREILGSERTEIEFRGAIRADTPCGYAMDYRGNPDALVVKAVVLLERRAPGNWAEMVAAAVSSLAEALAMGCRREVEDPKDDEP